MAAERRFRVGVEHIRQELQLPGIRPIIVAFQQRQIPATGSQEDLAEILFCADVALPQVSADDLGILLAIFPHDFPRAIGRAIISDDQLERKIGLLHEDALKGLGDEFLMVIRDHENAELRLGVRDVDIGHCELMPFSHESKSVVNRRRRTGHTARTRDSGSAAGFPHHWQMADNEEDGRPSGDDPPSASRSRRTGLRLLRQSAP